MCCSLGDHAVYLQQGDRHDGDRLFCSPWLLIPLLSLALTALIGGLVAFLASKLPFKTLVTTLLFALFFLAYMFFAMNMDVVIQVMAENGAQIASAFRP